MAVLAGWQWKCGIAALLAALVLTGAWVKSAVDRVVMGAPTAAPDGPLRLSGRIAIVGSRNSFEGSGGYTYWHVKGLYADATIWNASEPTNDELPDPPPHVDTGSGDVGRGIPSVAASSSPQERNANMDETTDAGRPSSPWRCCGFRFERAKAPDGSDASVVLIPHWFIVVPLLTLSAALLILRTAERKKASLAGSEPCMVQHPGADTGNVRGDVCKPRGRKWGLLTLLSSLALNRGWRGKLAIAMLLSAFVLTGGWVRSFAVTDFFAFALGGGTSFCLVSGIDGISFGREPDGDTGADIHYETFTGRDHEAFTLRPRADFAFRVGDDVETIDDMELTDAEPHKTAAANPDDDQAEPALFTLTTGKSSQTTNAQPAVDAVAWVFPGAITSGGIGSIGTTVEWGRLYISHGPLGTAVMVPYAFLVIPLSLIFVALLAAAIRYPASRHSITLA